VSGFFVIVTFGPGELCFIGPRFSAYSDGSQITIESRLAGRKSDCGKFAAREVHA
jgi:hypothetical protein